MHGFPFTVPHTKECLDEEGIRYLYIRRHKEDALVVPYNPELCILWGASHNVQRVANNTWLSTYQKLSQVYLPNNASEPQKYLRTRVIGSVEAVEVLMSFHQSQMTRQVIYLPTDVKPTRSLLKSKCDLVQLEEGSSDICLLDMDIEAGWVNGTLAVVTALYQNCVFIQTMSNPSQRISVPHFRRALK